MYERYNVIEQVAEALKNLEMSLLGEPDYREHCQKTRTQLEDAISYETGSEKAMSKYSSIYH